MGVRTYTLEKEEEEEGMVKKFFGQRTKSHCYGSSDAAEVVREKSSHFDWRKAADASSSLIGRSELAGRATGTNHHEAPFCDGRKWAKHTCVFSVEFRGSSRLTRVPLVAYTFRMVSNDCGDRKQTVVDEKGHSFFEGAALLTYPLQWATTRSQHLSVGHFIAD
ncbi:hypothetical protein TNCV_2079051 [Trichonephila clavipes]|nr:hypothetical protein TNCV_2079051 [Trichonephila clavipes]